MSSSRHEHLRSTMLQLEGYSPYKSPQKMSTTTQQLSVADYSEPQLRSRLPNNLSYEPHDAFCLPISSWSLRKRIVVFLVLWAIVGTTIALAVYFSNRNASVEQAKSSNTGNENNGLDFHNDFRANFAATALTWNETLATHAAEWAANCQFQHAGNNSHGEGENLCLGATTINGCAGLWADEEPLYNYSSPGFTEQTGHFTQMVWESTTQLGCALAPCSGSSITVCRYYPPGNVVNEGMFAKNVHQRITNSNETGDTSLEESESLRTSEDSLTYAEEASASPETSSLETNQQVTSKTISRPTLTSTASGRANTSSSVNTSVSQSEPSNSKGSSNGLDEHNAFRAKFSDTPDLIWNSTLEADAQNWANRCNFEHAGELSKGEGENLCSGAQTINDCVTMFESEEKYYNYSSPGFTEQTGHFTQMIWVSTSALGCAISSCDGSPLTVCRYFPAGNVVNQGYFEKNVKQPKD